MSNNDFDKPPNNSMGKKHSSKHTKKKFKLEEHRCQVYALKDWGSVFSERKRGRETQVGV